ncbi:MAG: C-type lectin domain-containing protein [Kofleriaceae bacterium]
MRVYTLGLVLLLVATGCDLAFDLNRPPDAPPVDGTFPYDRCGPFLYDEPLRYTKLVNPTADETGVRPWSWSDARTACRQRGMDLAVFNDEHELGRVIDDVIWPYWIGASHTGSTWSTVDECPALVPVGGAADSCGIVRGPNTIADTACTGAMPNAKPEEPPVVLGALCETPRPDDGPCLGNDPARTTYSMSPNAMTFAAARTFCNERGARPVVFETHAEWDFVGRLIDTELRERVWIGSTFDGTMWNSENSCPAHYSWAGGAPSEAPRASDCMGSVMLEIHDDDGPRIVLTGMDRMDCATDEMHALCEI